MSPRTAQVRGKLSPCNEYGKSTCGNLYPLRGAHHQQMYQGNKRTRDNRHHEEDAAEYEHWECFVAEGTIACESFDVVR